MRKDFPADSHRGYLATDGSYVEIPQVTDLEDFPVDIERFRAFARSESQKAAERSFSKSFSVIESEIEHIDHPWADKKKSDTERHKIVQAAYRAEARLMEARQLKIDTARARADAFMGCLESPQGALFFRQRLVDVLGWDPAHFAEGYASSMKVHLPWIREILGCLPPARLAAALSSLTRPVLFDPYRRIFHEDALEAFLQTPYGDLRHLELDMPKPHKLSDVEAVFRGVIEHGEVREEKNSEGAPFTLLVIDPSKSLPSDSDDLKQALGVTFDAEDLNLLERLAWTLGIKFQNATETRERLYWGNFLQYYLAAAGNSALGSIAPDKLWLYLATHLPVFDRALGLQDRLPTDNDFQPHYAMKALRMLPKVPARYKDAIFRIALGKKKRGRRDAQRLLRGASGLVARLEKEGKSRSLGIRLQAISCLGFSDDKEAVPVLTEMLAREKGIRGQNAVLVALKRLDALPKDLCPDAADLLIEAEKVQTKVFPDKRKWLADVDLPTLEFKSGEVGPVALPVWLLHLSSELAQPEGGPIVDMRLDLLTPASRKALGQAVLDAWLARDTQRWDQYSIEKDRERLLRFFYEEYVDNFNGNTGWLKKNDPARLKERGPLMSFEKHSASVTPYQLKEFMRGKTTWGGYIYSAYDARGALALARVLPAKALIRAVGLYLDAHGARAPQSKALIDLVASKNEKATINFLKQVAGNQSQKGLRTYAVEVLEDLGIDFVPPQTED